MNSNDPLLPTHKCSLASQSTHPLTSFLQTPGYRSTRYPKMKFLGLIGSLARSQISRTTRLCYSKAVESCVISVRQKLLGSFLEQQGNDTDHIHEHPSCKTCRKSESRKRLQLEQAQARESRKRRRINPESQD